MEYDSLTRALQLAEILAEGQFLTVAQMAERSHLHPRRVYRLLEWLLPRGRWFFSWLHHTPQDRFTLGAMRLNAYLPRGIFV